MGVVYRATQLRLTRTVALKLVTPALARDAVVPRAVPARMDDRRLDRPPERHPRLRGGRGGRRPLHRDALGGGDRTCARPSIAGRSSPARAVAAHLPGRERARRRPRAGPDPSRHQARQHPDHRRGPCLPDRLRADEARQLDQRADARRAQWVGTVDYTAPEQIEGSDRDPAHRRLLARLRALRGPDRQPPHRRENELATLWAHMYTAPPSVRRGRAGRAGGIRRRRAAGDGQGSRGALRVGGRARPRGAGRGHEARRSAAASGSPRLRAAGAIRDSTAAGVPAVATAAAARSWSALTGLLLIAAVVAIVSLSGSDEPRARSPTAASAASSARLAGSPPTGAACPPMPTARQNMDGTVVDGTIWVVGGLGSRLQRLRRGRGLRPRDQRLEGRSRPAGPSCTTRWP